MMPDAVDRLATRAADPPADAVFAVLVREILALRADVRELLARCGEFPHEAGADDASVRIETAETV